MAVQRLRIEVADSVLADLNERLASYRPVPNDDTQDWKAGMSPLYLNELLQYWKSGFDWRAQEARINHFQHFRASLKGVNVHFIHQRGQGNKPLPIVLTHGFPDSFLRFSKLIPLLTNPPDPADAFDVVVPSLPGYAFSDPILDRGGTFGIADLWNQLMTRELGYSRYGAHGGDWGSTITEHLGRNHPNALAGIHLTDVPFWHVFSKPHDLSAAEEHYFDKNQQWQMQEGAYAMIQGARPQTLADGLNDSPAGLAAWLVEKFQRWSDCGGDVETRFSKDELLSNVMLYWATETIGSSFLPYYDFVNAGGGRWMIEIAKQLIGSSRVPAGFAIFPKDISQPPREWAARFFDVRRWSQMPRGGHFAAFEEPELLAQEIRAFFRPLRLQN